MTQKRAPNPQQFLTSTFKVKGWLQRSPNAKKAPNRHPESEMHPRPTTRPLGWTVWMTTLTWTALGECHGTNQGLMRIIGRDHGTSQAQLEAQERKACGNPTETPRDQQPAQGINEIIHKDSKLTELKLNPHKNKRHHCVSTHKS